MTGQRPTLSRFLEGAVYKFTKWMNDYSNTLAILLPFIRSGGNVVRPTGCFVGLFFKLSNSKTSFAVKS